MFIARIIFSAVSEALYSGKIAIIYGPRQAGKTTLSKSIISETGLKVQYANADQLKYIDILSSRDLNKMKSLVSGYDLLFIDEAQRIPEIGLNLKILHDEIPNLKILVTGSSSFLLSNRISEALTGRKKIFTLLPFSISELKSKFTEFEIANMTDNFLVYGCYPEVIKSLGYHEKEEYLNEVVTSYLFKDILELENIKYPSKIRDILRLLAFQIGSQISIHEIGTQLKLNTETVERYLFLLEQSFIVFRLSAFSRNPRKEISKSQKYYFYDNGIRNAIIGDFKPAELRADMGALWENFLIAERRKNLMFRRSFFKTYFWRNYAGAEVDYVEEYQGKLYAFEIKLHKMKKFPPKAWLASYESDYNCITRDNYLQFV
jgi:predicted AAA+ superfamily ATPase